jgi:hypothetical protein
LTAWEYSIKPALVVEEQVMSRAISLIRTLVQFLEHPRLSLKEKLNEGFKNA